MVSIVGIVGLTFGTTAGLLVARIGPKRVILAALVLAAAVSAVQISMPSYPVMMASRVFEGVSHLAIVVVGPTAISGLAPARHQGAAMTLWSSFFGVAYAALFYFGPGVAAAHGEGAIFAGHAAWMLGCALLLWWLMPPDPAVKPATGLGGLWQQHREIYASAFVAAPAMGFACYTMTYVALLTLLPALMGPTWGGFVGVAMPLMSIAVSLTLGVWLLQRMTAVALVQAGFFLACGACAGLWLLWGQGPWAAGCALFMAGSLGIVQGASFASLPQLNPEPGDRARGAGAIAQLGNLGTTSGTPLLALAIQGAGISGLALFVIGFSVLGVAIHTLQARRRASV
jgi:predicted MFS family arabinose efflux permease